MCPREYTTINTVPAFKDFRFSIIGMLADKQDLLKKKKKAIKKVLLCAMEVNFTEVMWIICVINAQGDCVLPTKVEKVGWINCIVLPASRIYPSPPWSSTPTVWPMGIH